MSQSVLQLRGAALAYGARTLWSELDLTVDRGEFVAVLGANGSGKTSLIRTILGLQPLTAGTVEVVGRPVRRGTTDIGYVPQQRRADPLTPLRARDVVGQGLDGHRWGIRLPSRDRRERVAGALAAVGAAEFADAPVGVLSGGEQQRVRIAQALVAQPSVLLCDEPLLSLDLSSQRTIVELVDSRRRDSGTAVVFVTHEINPVLPYVDRVLYLAGGRFRIGTVDEVLTSSTLSDLYGVPIEVVHAGGRILVAGVPDTPEHLHDMYEGAGGMTVADGVGWDQIFNFADYGELLGLVHNSIAAGLVLGIVGGLISCFVMMRDLPFAVHGISELSFAGASGFLLFGQSVVIGSLTGSIVAALLIGALGTRARDRNSIIGVLMPFGLGLGVLFLSLYKGRAANKFGLLTGQIVAVDTPQLTALVAISAIVVAGLIVVWRPLTFASTDPELAAARGVPVRLLSPVFMLLLGLAVAMSVQVVGALLVLSIVCTPAAAAMRVTASPTLVPLLSVVFAVVSVVGGILVALGSSIPISPYVTTIAFSIYVVCRVIGTVRERGGGLTRRVAPAEAPA